MSLRALDPTLAIALMLTATAFVAGTMVIAQSLGTDTLGPPIHPLQISHGRFLFAFMAIAIATAVFRPKITNPHWRLHIGRTVFGRSGVTLMFAAVAFTPLSDATATSFLNPVFGTLLAISFLGEKVGPWRWLAAFMAPLGALILLHPGPDTFQVAGLLALEAALIMGMELIFIKRLSNRQPTFQILLINSAIGLSIASLAVMPVWQMPTTAQWGGLAALGVRMASAQACFVTPFSDITLIFATINDLLIFDVWLDWVRILGAAIILSGASLLAWRERR